MNGLPTVAVIIPTYNRAHLLVQALESVLKQSRPPDEILVVDDGSSDATADALVEYKNRIQYLRKPNGGLPSALNYGLAATDADYISILDDDDLAVPDAIERHLEFLHAHPDIDFSYSGCYRFRNETPPEPPYEQRLELYDCADITPDDLFLRALETYPFHTQGMLVPLRCYRAIGGFDETRLRAEDYDMILRLAQKFRGAKSGAPTFLLREHSGDRGPAHARHGMRAREAVLLQHGRKLFADLRNRLPLADYIRRTDKAKPLSDAQTRRALLQRACVMARHGLFPEAYEDLTGAIAIQTRMPITDEERGICSRMLDLAPVLLRGQGGWLDSVRRLLAAEAAPLFEACVAGLGWSMERQWRHRSYADTLFMMGSLCRLAGVSIFPLVAKRAWNKRFKDRASLT
jgi:glycosyltransferase involved in cell wall biosynthesis